MTMPRIRAGLGLAVGAVSLTALAVAALGLGFDEPATVEMAGRAPAGEAAGRAPSAATGQPAGTTRPDEKPAAAPQGSGLTGRAPEPGRTQAGSADMGPPPTQSARIDAAFDLAEPSMSSEPLERFLSRRAEALEPAAELPRAALAMAMPEEATGSIGPGNQTDPGVTGTPVASIDELRGSGAGDEALPPAEPAAASPVDEPPAAATIPSVDGSVPSVAEAIPPVDESVPSATEAVPSTDETVAAVEQAVPPVADAVPSVDEAVPAPEAPAPSDTRSQGGPAVEVDVVLPRTRPTGLIASISPEDSKPAAEPEPQRKERAERPARRERAPRIPDEVELPQALRPEGNGKPAQRLALAPLTGLDLSFEPGVPRHVADVCLAQLKGLAKRYGAVRVHANSAGPIRQLSDGGRLAPLTVRIVYRRGEALEARQSTIQCRLDKDRKVIGTG